MKRRRTCRTCLEPLAKGSKVYCPKHLKQAREYARLRSGYRPWKKGGRGCRPLESR